MRVYHWSLSIAIGFAVLSALTLISRLDDDSRASMSISFTNDSPFKNEQVRRPITGREKTFCPVATIQKMCSNKTQEFLIQMSAIPHTASSYTDGFFFGQRGKAWNSSVPIQDKGFVCPAPNRIHAICGFGYGEVDGDVLAEMSAAANATHLLGCVLEKLSYKTKQHVNYNLLSSGSSVLFTTLRDPAQFVLSQYRERTGWDKQWKREYKQNGVAVEDVQTADWARKAWWRHNLFTKMLATDTRMIWARTSRVVIPSKVESDSENALGYNSTWLQLALNRIKSMPFFGLMHRLPDSFELIAFHLCLPLPFKDRTNSPRSVDPDVEAAVKEHFVLDTLLLEEAEKIFDQMVAEMRKKKSQGYLCDLSKALKKHDANLALICV